MRLVQERAHVWLDRWELRVGDSIINRIQEAIGRADALLVVLTSASVTSQWCRRELNAGIVRELDEAEVLVLPVLAEDCEIPLFLRDKYYADFRDDFEKGLKDVLTAIAGRTSTTLGRSTEADDEIDYAIDWFAVRGQLVFRLTIVQAAKADPFTIICEIHILPNDVLSRRYKEYDEAGLDWVGRGVILELLRSSTGFADLRGLIQDDLPAEHEIESYDPRSGVGAEIVITCHRLGIDTGADILVPVGAVGARIIDEIHRRMRPLTSEERERVDRIRASPPT